jgi:hypothetical protein
LARTDEFLAGDPPGELARLPRQERAELTWLIIARARDSAGVSPTDR